MKLKEKLNIYQQAQRFADVTKSLIMSGNIRKAKRCLQIADKIFTSGNREVRNAVTNVYVFSLSTFLEMHRCKIKGLFPKQLQNEYYKQVNTSGI